MTELSHTPQTAARTSSAKQAFLDVYEREHATTMRVLRAYPEDQLDLRPHPKCKTARGLAWVFVLECGLGASVIQHRGQFSIYLRMAGAAVPSIYGPTADEPWM